MLTPGEWTDAGLCQGRSDLFFGPNRERPPARLRREAAARRLCASCPVSDQCREHARRHGELGVWGGETEAERDAAGFVVPDFRRRALARSSS